MLFDISLLQMVADDFPPLKQIDNTSARRLEKAFLHRETISRFSTLQTCCQAERWSGFALWLNSSRFHIASQTECF